MKKAIIRIVIAVIVFAIIWGLLSKISKLQTDYSYAQINLNAYALEWDSLQNTNAVFFNTIDELQHSQDSLIKKMLEISRQNGIKDQRIQQLQYQLETFNKTDTIFIQDTIFIDPSFHLDTCIVDNWNTSCISLSYPNNISIQNSYRNEKYIIVEARRELIRPSNCFLKRWFGRKHTVLYIDVIDSNPYVETERQRFVEIIE